MTECSSDLWLNEECYQMCCRLSMWTDKHWTGEQALTIEHKHCQQIQCAVVQCDSSIIKHKLQPSNLVTNSSTSVQQFKGQSWTVLEAWNAKNLISLWQKRCMFKNWSELVKRNLSTDQGTHYAVPFSFFIVWCNWRKNIHFHAHLTVDIIYSWTFS